MTGPALTLSVSCPACQRQCLAVQYQRPKLRRKARVLETSGKVLVYPVNFECPHCGKAGMAECEVPKEV